MVHDACETFTRRPARAEGTFHPTLVRHVLDRADDPDGAPVLVPFDASLRDGDGRGTVRSRNPVLDHVGLAVFKRRDQCVAEAFQVGRRDALEHGADVVIHSGTKYLNGHHDAMCGVVAGTEPYIQEVLAKMMVWGQAPDPFAAWLLERGLKTLDVRVQRQNQNTMRIANWCANRKEIKRVHYPGLTDHPDHDVAKVMLKSNQVRSRERFKPKLRAVASPKLNTSRAGAARQAMAAETPKPAPSTSKAGASKAWVVPSMKAWNDTQACGTDNISAEVMADNTTPTTTPTYSCGERRGGRKSRMH